MDKTAQEEAATWAPSGLHGGDHLTCPGSPGGNPGSEKQLLKMGREMKLKTEISLRAICRTSALIGSIVVRSQGRQRMSGKNRKAGLQNTKPMD